ncbi:MAG: hypothetical protein GXP14_15535 [Gammaproteobacteria bacterium]|nr:hypothetical protein [Gammaproteobacteria bacterium]
MIFSLRLFLFFLSLSMTSGTVTAAPAFKTSIGVGYFYSEGIYLDKDTSTLTSLPLFFKIQKNLTTFKVSSNIYRFDRKDSKTSEIQSSSGWGSSYFSLKQLLKLKTFLHYIDIEGKLNTPASNKADDLGTSKYGFKLSSTAYYWVSKNWLTANIAYRWRNNQLSDTFSAGLGFSRNVLKTFSLGTNLRFEQATQNISKNQLENTFHMTWKAHKKIRYTLYYVKGFKDLKLNWASGLQATYQWY